MTPTELRTRLTALDLTVNQFAELVRVTPWAVRKWLCDGKSGRKVPGPVIAWFEIFEEKEKVWRDNEHLTEQLIKYMPDYFEEAQKDAHEAGNP